MSVAEKLNAVFFNPSDPASFGSAFQLSRATGQPIKKVKTWLMKQNAYTLHAPVTRKFHRRKVIVGGIDHQWQCDLIDVASLKDKGVKFILTVIDVFSRYAWARAVPDKTNKSMIKAFSDILAKSGRKPFKLQSDDGTEFKGRPFKALLADHNIEWFSTRNMDTKAVIVERFNRTLMSRMAKYMTHTGQKKIVKMLPLLLEGYNARVHRAHGLAPQEVTPLNSETVWRRLYQDGRDSQEMIKRRLNDATHHLLAVDSAVRIAKYKKMFSKGYRQGWTDEVFYVAEVNSTLPTTYRLGDFNGEVLDGSFYRRELQHIDPELYLIEKIVRTRRRANVTEHLIKWKGYPVTANTWIRKDMLINL